MGTKKMSSKGGLFIKKKLGARPKALCLTFEKLFTGVKVRCRSRVQMYRAISMIYAVRPTFMKSTPDLFPLINVNELN